MPKNCFIKSIFLPTMIGVAAALSGCASTPGKTAVAHGDSVQLQQILDQPNHGGEDLSILLDDSVIYSNCVECARILFQAGARVSKHRFGAVADSVTGLLITNLDSRLALAAIQGHEQIAQLLIDQGAEPSAAKSIIRDAEYHTDNHVAFVVQATNEFFKKIEHDRASRPLAAAPAAPAAAVAPAQAARSRASPLFHDAERPDDYALIVGIEKYDDLPAATYAERDAAAAADFVGAMGVPARNIATLTGPRATRSGLAKKLEGWLANNVNENSTVYFYYSGHGAPDPKSGQAYLVPIDGDPEYLDQTAYPLKRVYEKLGALKAKRVIVMLDSCFSGAGGRSVLAKGARPLVTSVDTGFNSADGKIAVLAAAAGDQISGTSDEKGHGLFSYYLFNGLNGAAKDAAGQVTLKSLFDYLKPKVMDDAHRVNRDQVPQFQTGVATAGDVVLRAK